MCTRLPKPGVNQAVTTPDTRNLCSAMNHPVLGPAARLFLVSWLVLFLELALIRWLSAHVLYLTFFTNTVLLASFVGMSIGCLLAGRRTDLASRTPLWLAVTLGAGLSVQSAAGRLSSYVGVSNQANPDVVFFGTETSAIRSLDFVVPVELVMGVFFVLAAMTLVGPGQELGRAFNRVPSRTGAYAWNLLGSLAGIGSFAVCSYWQLPPVVWFAAAAAGLAFLARPAAGTPRADRWAGYVFLTIAVFASGWTSGVVRVQDGVIVHWSPYYRVDFQPASGWVVTNLIGHQVIESREEAAVEPYALPHLFRRDVPGPDGKPAWPAFRRVLIIGAGTGNDLSRACQWCPPDARIDAVDIDPVILALGRDHHPDRPYQDLRVTVHLNDGRNFLRSAPDGEYDLVVFALVDSLVLHSGYSNLRLESFLMTAECFRDVRRVLKPTGVAAVYNFFRQGWIVARLRDQLRAEFGTDPVCLTDPPRDAVELTQFDNAMFTAFFAGSPDVVGPMRAAFRAAGNSYLLPRDRPITPDTPARFHPDLPADLPPADGTFSVNKLGRPVAPWARLRTAEVEPSDPDLRPATDDWPFLYARRPAVPGLTLRGMGLVVVLALGLWAALRRATADPPAAGAAATVAGGADAGMAARTFFLGAGFMLIETKAVVQMALLFGSTWVVNTVVFAAILVMSLAGSLYAGWAKPRNLAPYYVGLFAALGLNLAVPLDTFLGLGRTAQMAGACALAFAPVAFAGVVFAGSFGRARNPDRVFGSNVAGALAGGLAENASLVVGFHYLVLVAAGFYLLSGLWGGNDTAPEPERV